MSEGGDDGLESKITVFSTKGQPPFVAVEHLANELLNLPYPVANPVILACSDLDPWGLRIAEQIDAKMRFFGFKSVTTYRVIAPQSTPRIRQALAYKPGWSSPTGELCAVGQLNENWSSRSHGPYVSPAFWSTGVGTGRGEVRRR